MAFLFFCLSSLTETLLHEWEPYLPLFRFLHGFSLGAVALSRIYKVVIVLSIASIFATRTISAVRMTSFRAEKLVSKLHLLW
jgi:hypothetical protein